MKRWVGATSLASLLFAALEAVAGPRSRSAFLESGSAQLRWDNIEGPPLWVAGQEPNYTEPEGLHLVRLDPGRDVTILLGPARLVRVHRPWSRLGSADIAAWISDGSGLEVSISPLESTDATSLVFHSGAVKPSLLRLVRPPARTDAIAVAIFVSRIEHPSRTSGFRELVDLPGSPSMLWASGWFEPEPYWRIPTGPGATPLTGPAELALETRLLYPATEAQQLQEYEIRVFVDGHCESYRVGTSPDTSAGYALDGVRATMGSERTLSIRLGEGSHGVRIEGPESLRVRLLRRGPGDFLISAPPEAPLEGAEIDSKSLELLDGDLADTRLRGAMRLRQMATGLSLEPDTRALALAYFRRHTQWRALIPAEKRTDAPWLAAGFAVPRLVEPDERDRETWLAPQHMADALKGFSPAIFAAAPARRDGAHTYWLPPRGSQSILRLIALGKDSAAPPPGVEWMVQFNSEAPFPVRAGRAPHLPRESFQPGPAEAALLQAGAGARIDLPWQIVPVSTAEFALPSRVERIRLWTTTPGEAPPVAIQQLSAAAQGESELESIEAARGSHPATSRGNPLLACWRRWHRGVPSPEPEWAEITRRSLPLFRFLSQNANRFQAGAMPPGPMVEPTQLRTVAVAAGESAAAARRFEASGDWLLALEAWSAEVALQDPETQGPARLERVKALEALGEHFLAERQLRGMFLHGRDSRLRDEALDRLLAMYRRRGDEDALLGALATAALESAEPRIVCSLAEAAANAGEYEMALALASSLPEQVRPFDLIARCAAGKAWWRVFDAAVIRIHDVAIREHWLGIGAADRGQPEEALRHFETSGQSSLDLAQSMRRALEIREALGKESPGNAAQSDPRRYLEALRAWAAWRASCPGRLEWRDDVTLTSDSAGGMLAYNPARDTLIQYHVSRVSRPLKARVAGPVVLRIESRPLHSLDAASSLDGWILVRESGSLRPIPVSGNLPAQGLTLIGADDVVPGAKVVEDVSLGPGVHEIEIGSTELELLIRLSVGEPEHSSSVLPLRCPDAALLPLEPPEPMYAELAEGQLGEVMRLAASSSIDDADTLRRRLTLLTYVAEQEPCLREEARVLGDKLRAEHLDVPELQPLHLRLTSSTEWKRLASVRSSAGLRKIELTGWQPEGPDLRVRRALLAPLDASERLVTTNSAMLVSFSNQQPVLIQLDLTLESLEYLPRRPLTVICQLDSREGIKVELSHESEEPTLGWSGSTVPVRLSVPEGEHALRVWIEKPIVNHFVRVRARELKDNGSMGSDFGQDLPTDSSRTYFVASPEKPLRLAVEGPAALQVDELQGGVTISRRQWLSPGWQEVVLTAPAGRSAALFRVFQRVDSTGREAGPPDAISEEGDAPTSAPSREGGPVDTQKLVFDDTYALGGQEDGTFSLSALVQRRRAFDEDRSSGEKAESYLEIALGHHYLSETLASYFDTTLLARSHPSEGPVVGLEEDVHAQPEWLPGVLRVAGSIHAQWPEGSALVGRGPPEWAGALRGGLSRRWPIGLKAYHAPSASIFGRYMSLDKYGALDSAEVDQDIFTPYKQDHKAGLVLSETLGYFPWRDTEWWGRAAITSNQSLNPGDADHLSAWAGWKQMVNGWELDATYLYQRFFNDSDRRGITERHSVSLLVLRDFWCTPRDRLAFSAEIRHDFPDDLNTAFVSLTWYFSGGRAYRDIWPGDENFLELKRARIPGIYNNWVSEAPR